MSMWSLFHRDKRDQSKIAETVFAGETPVIGSYEDMETHLKQKLNDAELAGIFVELLERLGKDGAFEIKRGGDGDPYRVEYVRSALRQTMTRRRIKMRKKEILARLRTDHLLSEYDIKRLQDELAQLADRHAIIWINVQTNEEFRAKEDLFCQAVGAARKLFAT